MKKAIYKYLILLILLLCGVGGNTVLSMYSYTNTIIAFGSAVSILILYEFGLIVGIICSIIISYSSIYFNGYLMLYEMIPVLGIISVGLIFKYYNKHNVLLCLTAYYIIIGMPLGILINYVIKESNLISFHYILNMLINTIIATILIICRNIIASNYKEKKYTIHSFDFIFTLIYGLTILPCVYMMLIEVWINTYYAHMIYLYTIMISTILISTLISRITIIPLIKMSTILKNSIVSDVYNKIKFPVSKIYEINELESNVKDMISSLCVDIKNRTLDQELSDEIFQILSDSSHIGIVIYHHNVVYLNKSMEYISGYTMEELGTDINTIISRLICEEYRKLMGDNINKRLTEKQLHPLSYELKIITKTGGYKWLSAYSAGINFEDKTLGIVSLIDITELKEKSQALQELTQRQQKIIEESIKEMRKQEAIIIHQSKLTSMGEMMATISHQWRQPLNYIGIALQGIEDAYASNELTKEFMTTTLSRSLKQLKRLSNTIDEFRSFFKPSKEIHVFNIINTILGVCIIVNAQLKHNFINLIIITEDRTLPITDVTLSSFDLEELLVYGYENELKHSLINIICNSKDSILEKRRKGMDGDGDGNIIIRINSCFETYNQLYNQIIIEDDGIGIEESIKDKVFEPYFTTKYNGTGTGLYMAKIIIENNMGGNLCIENKLDGNGCQATIELQAIFKNLL